MTLKTSLPRLRYAIPLVVLLVRLVTASGQPVNPTAPSQHTTTEARLEAQLAELLEKKQFEQASHVARQLIATRETSGTPDVRLAQAFVSLAEAEAGNGRSKAAADAYGRAVDVAAAALGPMHREVAGFLNDLGVFHFGRGDYAAAVPVFERALRIREQAFGPEAVETAEMLNNLAQVVQESGD
jgi:Tfp pilus assembly protein PilF